MGDLLEADVVPLGEGRTQAVGAAVRVPVQVPRLARERLERLGKRPVRPLVRGELDHPLEPELALHLLDRLPRLVRNEIPHGRLEERIRKLRERHAATLVQVPTHQHRVDVAAVNLVPTAQDALLTEPKLPVERDGRLVMRENG